MEVNYIKEINAMNIFELTHPLSATEFKVWCKLMHLANQEHFPERMHVQNTLLCSLVGCGESTLATARNKLMQLGRIDYKGRQKMTALYIINYFSCDNPSFKPGKSENGGIQQGDKQIPENNGYNGGYNRGINTGYVAGYAHGNNGGTYINDTRRNEMTSHTLSFREKFDNSWRTSERARNAIAQRVIDELCPPEAYADGGICKPDALHEVVVSCMADGMPPELILETCKKIPWTNWGFELALVQRKMQGGNRPQLAVM